MECTCLSWAGLFGKARVYAVVVMLRRGTRKINRIGLARKTRVSSFLFLVGGKDYRGFRSRLGQSFATIVFLERLNYNVDRLSVLGCQSTCRFLGSRKVRVVVIVRKTRTTISREATGVGVPFAIVTSPRRSLCRRFSVPSSSSVHGLICNISRRGLLRFRCCKVRYRHFRNGRLRLRTAVIISEGKRIILDRCSRGVDSIPSPSRLCRVLRTIPMKD